MRCQICLSEIKKISPNIKEFGEDTVTNNLEFGEDTATNNLI